jgi:GntR family transcriptional repressor for pyruvate dehydrogenase complex
MEVRRLLEPAATGLAALRISDEQLAQLAELLQQMQGKANDAEGLVQADLAFHRHVMASTGNETLTSLLDGLSGRTVRARVWRGIVEGNVTHVTIDEHKAIYAALQARDPALASAAALVHVNTSESWLRSRLRT